MVESEIFVVSFTGPVSWFNNIQIVCFFQLRIIQPLKGIWNVLRRVGKDIRRRGATTEVDHFVVTVATTYWGSQSGDPIYQRSFMPITRNRLRLSRLILSGLFIDTNILLYFTFYKLNFSKNLSVGYIMLSIFFQEHKVCCKGGRPSR